MRPEPSFSGSFWRFRYALLLIPMLCASGCAGAGFSGCPPWPAAGPSVADELETLPGKDYPALWQWLAALERLRDQLALCEGE